MPPWPPFENLFFVSSPEPKCQLIPNLVGSIGMTYINVMKELAIAWILCDRQHA